MKTGKKIQGQLTPLEIEKWKKLKAGEHPLVGKPRFYINPDCRERIKEIKELRPMKS